MKKVLMVFLLMTSNSFAGREMASVDEPIKMDKSRSTCQAKNNAPVDITTSRTGANVTITIKAKHDFDNAKIKFSAVDDLEFVGEPDNIEKDLSEGELVTETLKVKPTQHMTYIAVQVEGLLHNFPRVKTITVPIEGTSAFGHLPKDSYRRKVASENQKMSAKPKKKHTRKGRPVRFINE